MYGFCTEIKLKSEIPATVASASPNLAAGGMLCAPEPTQASEEHLCLERTFGCPSPITNSGVRV